MTLLLNKESSLAFSSSFYFSMVPGDRKAFDSVCVWVGDGWGEHPDPSSGLGPMWPRPSGT